MSLDVDKSVKSDRARVEFHGPGEFAAVVMRNARSKGPRELLLQEFMRLQRSLTCKCPQCGQAWSPSVWSCDQAARLYNFARCATRRQFWDRFRAEYLAFVAECPQCGSSGRLPEQLQGSTGNGAHISVRMFGQLITTASTARRTAG